MGEYAPITKGLREYIERHPTMMHAVGLTNLIDNIDAIQRSLEQENERLRDASEHTDDWIKLPVDADGVPIQIGDAVEHNGVVANVLGITFHGTTPPTVCICRGDCWVEADELHHAKPDTWESIISDAMRVGRADVAVDVMPLIKRCKALAGEDE